MNAGLMLHVLYRFVLCLIDFFQVIDHLETLVQQNKPISDVITGSEDLMSHFHKLFPEVTESNQTGKLSKDAFALWEDSKNNINIEMDTGNGTTLPKYDVYIGGPASAVAAALHAKSGKFINSEIFSHF